MIHIALAPDDNYVMPAAVTITSILENKKEDVCIYIPYLDNHLSACHRAELADIAAKYGAEMRFIRIAEEELLDFPVLKFGICAYLRLYLPTALPNVDKILYLDCDTIADAPLDELYHADISQYFFAAVADLQATDANYLRSIGYQHQHRPYVCSGVLLMNMEKLRGFPLMEKTGDYLAIYKEKIRLPDQDIINALFPDILVLPPRYMVNHHLWRPPLDVPLPWTPSEIREAIASPVIIHYYARLKPWYKGVRHRFRKRWLHYARLSPYSKAVPIKDKHIQELARKEFIYNIKYDIYANIPKRIRNIFSTIGITSQRHL